MDHVSNTYGTHCTCITLCHIAECQRKHNRDANFQHIPRLACKFDKVGGVKINYESVRSCRSFQLKNLMS